MHLPRFVGNGLALMSLGLLIGIVPTLADGATTKPKPKTQAAPAKPVEDRVTRNKKADMRRAELAKVIAQQQAIMDRYDKQNAFNKSQTPFWVTDEQYEAAKAARDKAQEERNELARQILN